MKLVFPLLCAVALVSACGGPKLTPEQKAVRKEYIARKEAALKDAKVVTVSGTSFQVAHIKENNRAIVKSLSDPMPYFAADVEQAARAVTGCKAKYDGGVLAYLSGDLGTVDLYDLSTKVRSGFDGWSVDLTC